MAEGFEMTIDKKDWTIKIEGRGFRDGKCLKSADELEKILGMGHASSKRKPDRVHRVSHQRAGK